MKYFCLKLINHFLNLNLKLKYFLGFQKIVLKLFEKKINQLENKRNRKLLKKQVLKKQDGPWKA